MARDPNRYWPRHIKLAANRIEAHWEREDAKKGIFRPNGRELMRRLRRECLGLSNEERETKYKEARDLIYNL